jgi:hypothetical protein
MPANTTVGPKEDHEMPSDVIEQSAQTPLVGDGVMGVGPHGVRIGWFALVARHDRLPAPRTVGRGKHLAVISVGGPW